MFSGKRVFEPTEAVRVLGALELVAGTLERGIAEAAALPPLVGAAFVVETGRALFRVRQLQFGVVTATAHWLATEGHLVGELVGRLRDLVASAMEVGATAVAAALPGVGAAGFAAHRAWSSSAPPAANLGQLLGRLEVSARRSSSLRIEQLEVAGHREFVVYLPGTENWSPVRGGNPFSLESDLRLYGGQVGLAPAASAVGAALTAAGVGSQRGDTVTFVGHSQGALLGARLASQPEAYRVRALITAGGPIAGVEVPAGVARVSLAHRGDVVPALAPRLQPDSPSAVTATLTAGSGGDPHDLASYRLSAEGIDAGQSYAKVRRLTQQILTPLAEAKRVQVTQWDLVELRECAPV